MSALLYMYLFGTLSCAELPVTHFEMYLLSKAKAWYYRFIPIQHLKNTYTFLLMYFTTGKINTVKREL